MRIISWTIVVVVVAGVGYFVLQNYSGKDTSLNKEIIVDANDDVMENLSGRWQSIDDTKSVKVFKKDGLTEEVYDGKIMNSGTWKIVDSFERSDGEIVTGAFLQTNIADDEFVYSIVNASETGLELIYIPRGNTLKFTRVE